MKKLISMLAVLTMLLTCYSAHADTYESPILFRGIQWGATVSDASKGLPEGVKMYATRVKEYWYPMASTMFDENMNDYYKAELGCYEYAQSSTLENVKVAGYNISDLNLYYVYTLGENGLLIKDDAHTALVYAYYKLEPKDPEAVYADLVKKLTSLYGDVDEHQKKSPYIVYEQNLWYGADGTMVSLVKEDYPSGSHYIYIKYGYSGADDLVAKAYDAVVLEEMLNAASNTDGL
ncbi:MAG: hypothetical protein J6K73_07465 [Clostridia bacterium]|nr:hypothetical protein [Clostridia bacterium]